MLWPQERYFTEKTTSRRKVPCFDTGAIYHSKSLDYVHSGDADQSVPHMRTSDDMTSETSRHWIVNKEIVRSCILLTASSQCCKASFRPLSSFERPFPTCKITNKCLWSFQSKHWHNKTREENHEGLRKYYLSSFGSSSWPAWSSSFLFLNVKERDRAALEFSKVQ